MESFIKADIFFFVATIAVIIMTVFMSVIAWYIVAVLKNVKESTDVLKEKIEGGAEYLEEIRKKVTESFIFNFIFKKKNPPAGGRSKK